MKIESFKLASSHKLHAASWAFSARLAQLSQLQPRRWRAQPTKAAVGVGSLDTKNISNTGEGYQAVRVSFESASAQKLMPLYPQPGSCTDFMCAGTVRASVATNVTFLCF